MTTRPGASPASTKHAMNIWNVCNGSQHVMPVAGTLHRLVESQEQIATLNYVDTLEEQAMLEDLLEQSKPPYPERARGYHYLLQTPFRYPPLQWGSRFGRVHEPSIFYGGLGLDPTLAESAYYRLVFWYSMPPHPTQASIDSAHTLVSARYRSARGIQLHQAPFSAYEAALTHPADYAPAQSLGSALREAGIDAFEYTSARDIKKGRCVGLFTPTALSQKKPSSLSPWLCETRADQVIFKPLSQNIVYRLPAEQFMIDGRLPRPA